MRPYDLLYDVYAEFDTGTLREYQRFIDIFPPVDSRIALEQWERATSELEERKREVAETTEGGRPIVEIVSRVTREQAFAALDLHAKYDRGINVLILDVDETLRSAGGTDNEIPRSTLAILQEFHEGGVPIVICTGQTLENVKGFAIQGFGASMVQSGSVSIVYEAGTGVFTPGHGTNTKRLLYEGLDDEIVEIFGTIRSRVLPDAPAEIRHGCHLQGNEFNITLKPNYETGSEEAVAVIERGLVHLIDLLGETVVDGEHTDHWARSWYAAQDLEIEEVLGSQEALPKMGVGDIPAPVRDTFARIDVALYEGDAAEISSLDLNKVAGVQAALDVLDVQDPFAIMLGDSKSDLRVMEWLDETNQGISAAPEHASEGVLEHVRDTDDLIFHRGRSVDVLRIVDALNRLVAFSSDERQRAG